MSQTVQRAIVIVEFLAERARGLSEVADRLGVHRSTALRLLQTLEANGFALRRADGRYAVGTRLIAIAQEALESLDVRQVAAPHIRALHQSCGHTIHLAQLVGREIIYIDKVESSGAVRMYSRIGRPASPHASGVGKVILAQLTPERREEVLAAAELTSHTSTTFDTLGALDAELERIAQRGWGVDDGEFEDFINCVAAPVRNSTGDIVAAVSITSLKVIAALPELSKLLPELRATTDAISRELG
ncbi:IclR family transcriptional regulator [Allonocardiopsis opalescens]|uniref:IclR family transcriptional regulator n=1 Tax=Allonocardiopsis opalescens TaxID=1144618 RepID=A0A2T0QAE8_9ACTN|nr:IclR family transcriptional regulator [Allonocardiopsis opalescens]PRY00813.1 IclR family transcriptional regulator [Allonocardiopsis opalescens]